MPAMDFKDLFPDGFDARKFSQLENAEPPSQAYLTELQNFGMQVYSVTPTDDRPIRCKMVDEKSGKKSGWYYYNPPDPHIAWGAYGDWRKDVTRYWSSVSTDQMDPVEHAAHRERMQQIREQHQAQREINYDKAAKRVQAFITELPYAITHEYLTKKQVNACGILYNADDDQLIVPVRNMAGEIRSCQRIWGNSDKKFFSGGQTKGCFYMIGSSLTEPTYIVEGFATGATVFQATGKTVLVAFNAGNLQLVVEAFREAGNPHQLIIAADNDRNTAGNPGLEKAYKAAEGQFGVSVVYPEFKGTEGTDFNDLMLEQGIDAVKKYLVPHAKSVSNFEINPISELSDPEPIDWLIEDFLVSDTLLTTFGPSGCGKTFLAIDMGLHVAAGIAWHGRKVKQGAVVYICGEGRRGVITRIHAWLKHHDQPNTIPFYVSKGPLLLLESDSVAKLTDTIHQSIEAANQKVGLIIIDTLNRNFGDGDENSTKDMTQFINRLTDARIKTGAAINIVHHTGLQDTHRARGNSALRAALDTELSVLPFEHGFTLKTTKQKDAEEYQPISFKHKKIELENDLTSIVITPDKDPQITQDLTKNLQKEGHEKRTYRKIIEQYKQEFRENCPEQNLNIIEKTELNNRLTDEGISQFNTSKLHKWAISQKLLKIVDSSRFECFVGD